MTGRDIVSASLRLIGAIAPGETASASEASEGLAALSRLLGSWSTEELLVNARVRETLTLTPSDGSYTMGSGGNLDTTRAQQIDQVRVLIGSTEHPVSIPSLDEWARISVKDIDGIPSRLYHDGAYPLDNLYLYPRPSSAMTLIIWSWKPFSAVSTLDTEVSLQPGADRALIFNLALDLAPEYGLTISDYVMGTATESKAGLKRMNHRASYLRVDSALVPRGRFNMRTGENQ